MQALLSFDQAPPIAAPFRFFLTAPVFGVLAGLLLLWVGPELFVSRWSPATLAMTHLVTVGFMLQVMLGALVQILPVVAGANLRHPLSTARVVHGALVLGVPALVAGFFTYRPWCFGLAAALLGGGVLVFVLAAGRALAGLPPTSPTIRGLKLALAALFVTVGFGVLLAVALAWQLELPLPRLTDLHLGWGLAAWGTVLLAAVGYVVVPMFQLTPAYPDWFGRVFARALLFLVAGWTGAELAGQGGLALALSIVVATAAAAFAVMTLWLQRRSKRAKLDATQRYWRFAMACAVAAYVVWVLAQAAPAVGEWAGWPLLFGVALLCGGFMSVIVGMLYKIVPFLVWLHLQNRGGGRVVAPNMKKVLAEAPMLRQMRAHFAACALLAAAVFWPLLAYPAGLALMASNLLLAWNLWSALRVYRAHLVVIEARLSQAP